MPRYLRGLQPHPRAARSPGARCAAARPGRCRAQDYVRQQLHSAGITAGRALPRRDRRLRPAGDRLEIRHHPQPRRLALLYLVVCGAREDSGPTHTHGMSRPSARKIAGKRARKPGARLSWYRARSAVRECANSSHRSAGWRSPRRFRHPAPGTAGVHWPGVEVHPPAPRPPWGAHRGVTRELPRRGPDRALAEGEVGRARGWGERLTQ